MSATKGIKNSSPCVKDGMCNPVSSVLNLFVLLSVDSASTITLISSILISSGKLLKLKNVISSFDLWPSLRI